MRQKLEIRLVAMFISRFVFEDEVFMAAVRHQNIFCGVALNDFIIIQLNDHI